MGRRGYIMAGCAIGALVAASVWAGWSANWPSREHQRELYGQILDVYSGTVERCYVTGLSLPTNAATGWRDARADIIELKAKLKVLVPYFVKTNEADADGTFKTWFAGGTNTTLPMWTVAGLCSNLNIPQNWFDYTPYRALSGLGWDTTDATVGYPHGLTNASTADGGADYPSGRGKWYTTDYGVAEAKEVIGQLVWTSRYIWDEHDIGFYKSGYTNQTQWEGDDYWARSDTWAASTNIAETNYQQKAASGYEGRIYQSGLQRDELSDPYYGKYGSHKQRDAAKFIVIEISTNFEHSADVYMYSDRVDLESSPSTYTNWGVTNWIEDQYAYIETLEEDRLSERLTSQYLPDDADTSVWCEEPVYNTPRLGMEIQSGWMCLKWNGENGFSFK